jgi:hypothetical protein
VTCLVEGGRVALLTATHFDCIGGGLATDAGGPLGNLVLGGAALLLTAHARRPALRYFLALLAAFNLCWFAAEFLYSPVTLTGDQFALAARLGLESWWRGGSIAVGVALYAIVAALLPVAFRHLVAQADQPGALARRIVIGHIAATGIFTLAGSLWSGDRAGSAWEAFLTIGPGALPMWLAVGPARRRVSDGRPVAGSWIAGIAAAAFVLLFLLSQATGLGTHA